MKTVKWMGIHLYSVDKKGYILVYLVNCSG